MCFTWVLAIAFYADNNRYDNLPIEYALLKIVVN